MAFTNFGPYAYRAWAARGRMLKNFAAALFVLSMVVHGSPAEAGCVQYEPHVVSLRGTVIYRTFADANGQPERSPLLLLDNPICVEASAGDAFNVSEGDQIIIHLNADPEKFGRERAISDRRVVAKGSLYHNHTAHHHAALVLTVQELRIEDGNKPVH